MDPLKTDNAIGKLVYDYFSPVIQEKGKHWAEKVALKNKENLEAIREKIEKKIEDRVINEKEIEHKFLVPYLQYAALEENETLQELWANLFVNTIDANKNLNSVVYPDILRQLSTNEVELIWYMRGNRNSTGFGRDKTGLSFIDNCTAELIGNLERLGLVVNGVIDGGSSSINIGDSSNFRDYRHNLTPFGVSFIDACSQ
jgi:hypothetical protein